MLEPLGGYLLLAEHLTCKTGLDHRYAEAFNFGPDLEANRTVRELVSEMIEHWNGIWRDVSDPHAPHEAGRLHLQIDKAHHQLNWHPRWDFKATVERTVSWYKAVNSGERALTHCLTDIDAYQANSNYVHKPSI